MVPTAPGTPENDGSRDDLAALDYSLAGLAAEPVDDGAGTDLGAILGDYYDTGASERDPGGRNLADEPDPLAALAPADPADADDSLPMFTVTNPPGTVTVTTHLDGRVHRIELAPEAARLPETVVADEIVLIADLAAQDARSAQYTIMLDGMCENGHDNAATRDFLNRDLDLPTPEQAAAARAELFTTRYAGEQ